MNDNTKTKRRNDLHYLEHRSLELDIQAIRFRITLMEKNIMAQLEAVFAALEAQRVVAEEERVEVLAALDILNAQIVALQEQIAQGQAATPADLDAVIARIDATTALVEGIQP